MIRVTFVAVCFFALGVLVMATAQDYAVQSTMQAAVMCEPVPEALLLSHPIPYDAVVHQSGLDDPGKPKLYVRKTAQ